MKFRDNQFREVLELIQAGEAIKSRKDHRRASRSAIRVPVSVKFDKDPQKKWTEAKLHDVSARGVKLETPTAAEVGGSFLLRLPSKEENEPSSPLICLVVHCTPTKESFMIGAEFTGRLTQQQPVADAADDLNRIKRMLLD